MLTTRVNLDTRTGLPAQQRILTVVELAAQLQDMIDRGQGNLPVFASDGRACYPFSTVVPYTPSGYPECLLVKPAPHLHAGPASTGRADADYVACINADADRVRAACGAFHP